MFQIGDRIVHPMHGAGVVDAIVQQKINGVLRDYYRMKLPVSGMLVMIPTDRCEEIGVRPVLSPEEMDGILRNLAQLPVDIDPNWNHRYRENMLRLKSGDPTEVSRVIKCLTAQEQRRGLSTGERKLLHSARGILASEVALVQSVSLEEAERRILRSMKA